MNLQEIIEGLINSESNEGCASGFSVVQKKWVRKLEDYLENMKREEKEKNLANDREWVAQKRFEQSTNETLEIPDEAEIVDTDKWEHDGDTLTRRFGYTAAVVDDENLNGVFIVTFEKNSADVIYVHSNTQYS